MKIIFSPSKEMREENIFENKKMLLDTIVGMKEPKVKK